MTKKTEYTFRVKAADVTWCDIYNAGKNDRQPYCVVVNFTAIPDNIVQGVSVSAQGRVGIRTNYPPLVIVDEADVPIMKSKLDHARVSNRRPDQSFNDLDLEITLVRSEVGPSTQYPEGTTFLNLISVAPILSVPE